MTQIKDARDNQINFDYNNSPDKVHQLKDCTVKHENVDVKTALDYDLYGNVTSTSTQKSDLSGKKIETSAQYTQNGNYISKQTDSRGKDTEFTVNENNGNVTKTKNPNNVETNYVHTRADRLASETCGNVQTSYSYLNGVISSISHKVAEGVNTAYNFICDMFGNISEIKVGERTLAKNTYDAGNGLIRQTKYGNEQTVNYEYDDKGRLVKKSFGYEKGNKFGEITYSYDDKNRISEIYDSANDLTVRVEYDKFGRLSRVVRSDGINRDIKYSLYNSLISKITSNIFKTQTVLENTFGKQDKLLNSEINIGNVKIISNYNYSNDTLGRLLHVETTNDDNTLGLQHEFDYLDVENDQTRTTNFISSVEIKKKVSGDWTSTGEKFNYTYDNLGNITAITNANDSPIASYEYDSLNQLVRENNVQTGKTVTYTYNAGGNLTEKKIYSYTTDSDLTNATLENTITYTYGDSNWADKLTSYDGQDIVYDAIGNPLEYRGWEFEWSRGRRLDKVKNSLYNVNVAYKYDESGIRTQKIVNGVQTDFVTDGIKVLAQKTGNNTLIWQVDGNGNTVGFNYNGTPYFYMKNLQGDIIGITDTSGNIVAKYTYDSWGELVSIKDSNDVDRTTDENFIGYINPLRYRGYYYDTETGLYYLNARYYDPEVGRFINADETLSGGYNLFEYCYNNPIEFVDYTGKAPYDLFDTMDAAAIDWAYYCHPKAKREGREYASLIFQSPDGRFYYKDAIPGGDNFVEFDIDPGTVGWVHSHHCSTRKKANIFAIDGDVYISEDKNIPGYVVTPAGDIQKYVPLGNYGNPQNPKDGNVGTLTWIHYDWDGLGSFYEYKRFFLGKNALDKELDRLRESGGVISGKAEYTRVWNLVNG